MACAEIGSVKTEEGQSFLQTELEKQLKIVSNKIKKSE